MLKQPKQLAENGIELVFMPLPHSVNAIYIADSRMRVPVLAVSDTLRHSAALGEIFARGIEQHKKACG